MKTSATMLWQSTHPAELSLNSREEIHIWRAYFDHHFDQLPPLKQLLSPDEQLKAAQFKFAIHQQRFTIARAILRKILTTYLKCRPEEITFNYTSHGKPSIATPLSNPPLYFNISHSENMALYAFGLNPDLGVDIENLQREIEAEPIAERFFAADETNILKQQKEPYKNTAFYTIWTKKEAFIKAIGQGLSFPLKDFVVSLTGDPHSMISIKNAQAQDWSLFTLYPESEYIGALAVKQVDVYLKLWNFS